MESRYPNSQQVPPMKYGNKPSDAVIERTWASGDWFLTEKKDGAFYQLEKTNQGEIYLFGRTKSKVTGEYTEKIANVPHIKEWAESLPNGTTLIGEIYVPGGKSNDVTKIMGCTPQNAYKRQFESDAYGGKIHYYVFDCIRYKGKDLCNVGAYDRVEQYLNHELADLFGNESYIEKVEIFEDNFEQHLKDIFAAGGEGAVFKHKDCPYRPGKRTTTSQMYKYKQHLDSIDLICIGIEDPEYYYTGKEAETWPYKDDEGNLITKAAYYGWKNALRLGAYKDNKLIEVGTVASGLTDAIRENLAENPDDWIGSVIECEAMSVTKDGALRHPVFIRKRDDKNPAECLWDEIFK